MKSLLLLAVAIVWGTIGYGTTSLFSQEAANNIYGNQCNGLKNVGKGFAYLGNQAWQGNWNTVGKSLTGGENQSGAFRVGYAGVGIASLFAGGELGEVGTASRSAEVADAAGQAAMRARVLANIAESQAVRVASRFEQFERRVIARDYFDQLGMNPQEASIHMSGIDFAKPVDVLTVPAQTRIMQWTFPKSGVGNYFAPLGSTPAGLGIHGFGRVPVVYESAFGVQMLRSTAAPIIDTWSVRGMAYPVEGGEIQLFNPRPGLFHPIEP